MTSLNQNNLSTTDYKNMTINKWNISLNDSKFDSNNNNNFDVSSERKQYTFKIIVVGAVGIGKTSVIHRFIDGDFKENYKSTLTAEFSTKPINIDAMTSVELKIWDTAGAERFMSTTKGYFRDSQGLLLMFDIGDKETYKKLPTWIKLIKDKTDLSQTVIYLIGNKKDRERKVLIAEGEKVASDLNAKYFEISAKTGVNVELLFDRLTRDMIKKANELGTNKGTNISKINKSGLKLTEQGGNKIKVTSTAGHKIKKDKDISCC